MSKFHFKNLDGLRFIAAFLVILEHCTMFKDARSKDLSNVFKAYFSETGGEGVNLFFVLSGFLITYLLMVEKDKNQTISIKKFYVRRVLRIWPLYITFGLVSILGAYLLLPQMGLAAEMDKIPHATNFLYFFTFCINYQLIFGPFNRVIPEVFWSVCVEEQFYLIWPWLVEKLHKRIIPVMLSMIFIAWSARWIGTYMFDAHPEWGISSKLFCYNSLITRLDLFAIGGIGAWLFYNKSRFTTFFDTLNKTWVQMAIVVTCTLFVFKIVHFEQRNYLNFSFEGLLYMSLIFVAIAPNCFFNLENAFLKKMGTYSYGIYMYHSAVAQVGLILFAKFLPNSFLNYDLLYPMAVTVITCVVSALSYELFERFFLKLKDQKFSV